MKIKVLSRQGRFENLNETERQQLLYELKYRLSDLYGSGEDNEQAKQLEKIIEKLYVKENL